jgi:hypothetical protein
MHLKWIVKYNRLSTKKQIYILGSVDKFAIKIKTSGMIIFPFS